MLCCELRDIRVENSGYRGTERTQKAEASIETPKTTKQMMGGSEERDNKETS